MTDKNPDPTHIRLAKRVAEQLNCSRSTAEQFIEGGFVSVDGQVVEAPGARVRPDQAVTVAQDASLTERYRRVRTGAYIVSANSSRPISMQRISLVPAPISYSLASRHRRPSG